MKTTEEKVVVNSEDVCRIIKACANAGVRELHFGALTVFFGATDQSPKRTVESGQTNPFEIKNDQDEEVSPMTDAQLQTQAMTELDDLMLSDPLEYERRLSEGMIDNEEPRSFGVEPTI